MSLSDGEHGYGTYTSEQLEQELKAYKLLRSAGTYYLDENETEDMFLFRLQKVYQDVIPIKGWNQIDILAMVSGIYMDKGE